MQGELRQKRGSALFIYLITEPVLVGLELSSGSPFQVLLRNCMTYVTDLVAREASGKNTKFPNVGCVAIPFL